MYKLSWVEFARAIQLVQFVSGPKSRTKREPSVLGSNHTMCIRISPNQNQQQPQDIKLSRRRGQKLPHTMGTESNRPGRNVSESTAKIVTCRLPAPIIFVKVAPINVHNMQINAINCMNAVFGNLNREWMKTNHRSSNVFRSVELSPLCIGRQHLLLPLESKSWHGSCRNWPVVPSLWDKFHSKWNLIFARQ